MPAGGVTAAADAEDDVAEADAGSWTCHNLSIVKNRTTTAVLSACRKSRRRRGKVLVDAVRYHQLIIGTSHRRASTYNVVLVERCIVMCLRLRCLTLDQEIMDSIFNLRPILLCNDFGKLFTHLCQSRRLWNYNCMKLKMCVILSVN